MREEKRGRGRPAGVLYRHKVFSLLSDQQFRWFEELARRRQSTRAELFRRLVEEAAKREKLE